MVGRVLPLCAEQRFVRLTLMLAAAVSLAAGIANSTLIFDDPFLYEAFGNGVAQDGVLRTAIVLLLNLDLHAGVPEYRSYGLSKLLHFGLWFAFGTKTWLYSAFIALAQALTALAIFVGLRRAHLNRMQALLAALLWMLSPFAATSCFHHYSYLILPVQITVALALWLSASQRRAAPLTWLQAAGIGLGGVALALTGESHLVLAACLLGWVTWASAPLHGRTGAWTRYMLVMGCAAVALGMHRLAWGAFDGGGGVRRFEFANPGVAVGGDRAWGYALSTFHGARVQVQQILEFSGFSLLVFLFVAGLLTVWLRWRAGRDRTMPIAADAEPSRRLLCAVLGSVVLASLSVSWLHHVFFSPVGAVLPRRYAYVPYTLMAMSLAILLFSSGLRSSSANRAGAVFVSAVVGLWCALQFICLPSVRYQDRAVWREVVTATAGKPGPVLLFVNAWDFQKPTGYNAPGLRGTHFPPLFESPFMRHWWQSQYARVVLGVAAAGNAVVADPGGRPVLAGQVSGVHFLPTRPVVADAASIVAVVALGQGAPDWRHGPPKVRTFAAWDDFRSSAAFLQSRIEVGWLALLNGVFNGSGAAVVVDAGRRADSARADVLPDKRFGEAPPSAAWAVDVRDYGMESGDDSVYLPNGRSGEPLAYLTSNRHGNFTYRIDFAEPVSRLVSLDFLDVWSKREGARVMHVQVELDGRWYDLGDLDTYAIAGNVPFALRIPIHGVQSMRLRLEKAAASEDVPFLNGIRLQPLP
jgi:hypothetical protein